MADRAHLHVTKLADFSAWLEGKGYTKEKCKGEYEVARFRGPDGTAIVWRRDKFGASREHYVVAGLSSKLLDQWFRERDQIETLKRERDELDRRLGVIHQTAGGKFFTPEEAVDDMACRLDATEREAEHALHERSHAQSEADEARAENQRLRSVLEWYAEKAEALHRYSSAKPPKEQAMMAVVAELCIDRGRRAHASLTSPESRPEEGATLLCLDCQEDCFDDAEEEGVCRCPCHKPSHGESPPEEE